MFLLFLVVISIMASGDSKPHPPGGLASTLDKNNVSVGSMENERYSLEAQSCSDHDNEDEFMVHSDEYSLCMCVFDGHDGSHAVKFMKKYMNEQVFSKPMWNDITKSSKPEKIEAGLANYIEKADDIFFKNIDSFITKRQELQSKIPKVILLILNNIEQLILVILTCYSVAIAACNKREIFAVTVTTITFV